VKGCKAGPYCKGCIRCIPSPERVAAEIERQDRKAGYSSMCRIQQHVQCQSAGAICTCICHGRRKVVKAAKPATCTPAAPCPAPKVERPAPKPKAERKPRPVKVPPPPPPPVLVRPDLRKEDAACCQSRLDDLGRYQPGFCGPDCERRPR
jgi:hypothetical protein